MPLLKQKVKRWGLRLMAAALGHARMRHLGRVICCYANADGLGDDHGTNGEGYLMESLAGGGKRHLNGGRGPLHVLEVGANQGQQTQALAESCLASGLSGQMVIHSFEPSRSNYARLQAVAEGWKEIEIRPVPLAAGGEEGTAALTCFDSDGGGTNSLVARRASATEGAGGGHEEIVGVTTLDAYSAAQGIDRVYWMRTDTEGNEMNVLRGAAGLLRDGRIDYIEFEYNSCWIDARCFLADAFSVLTGYGYAVGKLRMDGVEEFTRYDYRLEWFEHGNYVAWRRTLTPPFRVIRTESYLAL